MSEQSKGKRAVVVGGGWSGIAAAWYLHQAGAKVDLFDDQSTLGGRSRSVALGDRTATLGGKNIGKKYARFRRFVNEHGDGEWEHFGISTSQIDRGKLTTIEGSRRKRATFELLSHARPADVVRLFQFAHALTAEPANRFLDGPAFMRITQSRDRQLSDVFGKHLTQRLIRPMTIRMNGAEPDEAFLGNFGTNLSLILDSFDQLTDGFEPVFRYFERIVDVHHKTTVTELHHTEDTIQGISFRSENGTISHIDADIVVVALPAVRAAELMHPLNSEVAGALKQVPYHPVGVVVAAYDKDIFGEVGRAVVFPEGHAISNAGAYGRDDRRTVRYTFSGRAARPLLHRSPGADELLAAGEQELGRYFPLAGAKAVHAVSEVWKHGLCSYGPDHHKLSQKLLEATRRTQGLTFAGDYIAGASIEACFVSAERAISNLFSFQPAAAR